MSDVAHPDDLVTITKTPTEFQANILVAVLREAGIEAFAFGTVSGAYVGMGVLPVPVQVRSVDLERAKEALKQNASDSVDLDWDEIDVGEREDQTPLTHRKGMPLMARISITVAAIIVIVMILDILIAFVLTLMY